MGYFYIFGTIFFTVYGQLIIKWRIVQYGALPEVFSDKIVFLFKLLFDPFIFSSLASGFVASFFWMAAMTKFNLSYAYPFITAGLTVLTVTASIIILKENLDVGKIIGILLILLGVIVLGINSKNI